MMKSNILISIILGISNVNCQDPNAEMMNNLQNMMSNFNQPEVSSMMNNMMGNLKDLNMNDIMDNMKSTSSQSNEVVNHLQELVYIMRRIDKKIDMFLGLEDSIDSDEVSEENEKNFQSFKVSSQNGQVEIDDSEL
tara:strand:+ start:393 stop:800 length:408 start_codon:yes stop_codon:yes gene_type:complete